MTLNLVKALHMRDTGRPDLPSSVIIRQKLEQLYLEEWWFDHGLLSVVLRELKSLAVKHKAVRVYAFEILNEWEEDKDSRGIVFLARRLARGIQGLKLDYLLDLTDEIMMCSN